MFASELYELLEKEFVTKEMTDDWYGCVEPISDFVCDNFKNRSIGLVCDFTDTIDKVYTAVFPSQKVMEYVLLKNITKAMLFIHHPATWDIRKAPDVFIQIDRDLLKEFKSRKISIFNFHVPLDNFGKYSTSVSLANKLGIKSETAFGPYFGALCGVYGKTEIKTMKELKEKYELTVGHEVKYYNYGENRIDGKVAIVAGGGLSETIEEIAASGVKVFITGITAKNEFSEPAHTYAKIE